MCRPDTDYAHLMQPLDGDVADQQAHNAMTPHSYEEPAYGYMVNDANPSGRMVPDPRARCATCGIERWEHADAMADWASDPRPSDINGHPSDSPGGVVGARPAILVAADALGLPDCGPGCTCRGQAS